MHNLTNPRHGAYIDRGSIDGWLAGTQGQADKLRRRNLLDKLLLGWDLTPGKDFFPPPPPTGGPPSTRHGRAGILHCIQRGDYGQQHAVAPQQQPRQAGIAAFFFPRAS